MTENDRDRDFAKLKYAQSLEGMRHVQKVEAIEIGLVVVAYGIAIAGLLNARPGGLGRSGVWALAIFSVLVAAVLIFHFWRRRESYYRHVKRLEEALRLLGETCNINEKLGGILDPRRNNCPSHGGDNTAWWGFRAVRERSAS